MFVYCKGTKAKIINASSFDINFHKRKADTKVNKTMV